MIHYEDDWFNEEPTDKTQDEINKSQADEAKVDEWREEQE